MFLARIQRALSGRVLLREETLRLSLATLLSGGHLLLEDVPGTGKTTFAKALARVLGLSFSRIQMTPDLLPQDLTGVYLYREGSLLWQKGPVFAQVLLVDELNRATPRTQSALLEAMGEGQVTLEGKTHPLPEPFFVLATQNPVEEEGTYPLPVAQRDRFTARLSLGYPDEKALLQALKEREPLEGLEAVTQGEEILALRQEVRRVRVAEEVLDYLLALAGWLRSREEVRLGPSPRALLQVERLAQALALLQGRTFTVPEDIKEAFRAAIPHRLLLRLEAELSGASPEGLVAEALKAVPAPVERA
ncbi:MULTISPECIES: MoxR family ATPase [Thermus]|uniref:AAA family ATPase n=3 Tax=Thermus TaxID=270 RepID=A0A0N1KPP5_THESC|nr:MULTISPECIES: MoxR family ATPase [Thermus]ADW20737.1 ATPase associated with various cellular activities, AAA_3 [Thermus scotoductus SA-01]ETN87799.1 magnesium chelatase [Thermus sp. NMX2.A1]KPD32643.1 AAA family ATPase [Thermus scotoductus]WCM40639.1 AAA domain-containing protein [Thermus antranikianii]